MISSSLRRIGLLAVVMLSIFAVAAGPDLSFPDLHGQPHSLAEYRGKVTVVNFWATWCAPCRHEMPLFAEALKRYGADRFQVVAISLDDNTTQNKIPAFAEKQKMSFPILLGDLGALHQLGLGEAVPATVFLDADGHIVARVLGEISKSELKARLEWLLNGKTGKAPPEIVNNVNKKRDAAPAVPMMR